MTAKQPKARKRKTPWQKIMRAFRDGRSLRLSAAEVADLGMDNAIERAAANHDDSDAGIVNEYD